MSGEFDAAFEVLKVVLRKHSEQLTVGTDTEAAYSLLGRVASPFPQHKGRPMWFGEVRLGNAYVSFHLMPLYMNPRLEKTISAALKKRMQGKTCFNFKKVPDAELMMELEQLTAAALEDWAAKQWI